MRLSDKFPVPQDAALLYEFVNSRDLRRYVEGGVAHRPADELSTVAQMEDWLRTRGLAREGVRLDAAGHGEGLALREALRSFLQLSPGERTADAATAAGLDVAARPFSLALQVSEDGAFVLRPSGREPNSGLGAILAELYRLSETGRLDRLKICGSDECHWMFYDRSKPGNRRWCSSAICGNRQKTRSYRERRRGDAAA